MIETEWLLMRPATVVDLDDVFDLHSQPGVYRHMPQRPREWLAARLEQIERDWAERGYGQFALIERAGGRFVGRAGLTYWPQFDEIELGWVLHPDVWGRGYATEAGRASADFGFANTGAAYLTAMIAPANEPSQAVARRLGMTRLRDDTLFDTPVIVHALERPRGA